MRIPSAREIAGLFRSRTPIESPTYEERYNEALRELAGATFPSERYEALTEMAAAADRLGTLVYVESLGTSGPRYQQMQASATKWRNVRWLCLAIAATEHGLILVDPSGHLTIVNDLADDFVALAEAADNDDHEKRARVLYAIAAYFTEDSEEPGDEYAGLTPFIDDIAATELSARRLTLTPEESTR
jgi:hypothetical protein